MTDKSKLFDNIRVKPRRGDKPKVEAPQCEWEEGCDRPGTHRAPKNQRSEGGFHNFCIEHVRQYNKAFNYFADLKEDEITKAMRRSAQTGDRPTWDMGANPGGKGNPRPHQSKGRDFSARRMADPHNLFARLARNRGTKPITAKERRLLEADRQALEILGLEGKKTSAEIKTAYKALVKIHHPDANGGDRGSEDRLRAIITAYTHLKQKGFV